MHIPGFIARILRAVCALLCEFIYPAIAELYQVFVQMGYLFYNDSFKTIYNKSIGQIWNVRSF